jgi:hypothetical protein
MTAMNELQKAFDEGFDAVKGYVDRSFDAYAKRIEALEQAQSAFQYRGVWRADESYRQNNFATFGGGLWVAKIDSTGLKPGDNNSAWQLAVKAGRDGRDANPEEIARALLPDVLAKIEGVKR